MNVTYINSTTTGTAQATQLNSDGRAIVVRKIMVGNPVVSGNIVVFNENNALANNTTQIAYKKTYQASFTSVEPETVFDFRAASGQGGSVESDGIFCPQGGSVSIDQTMQVSVFWDYSEGN